MKINEILSKLVPEGIEKIKQANLYQHQSDGVSFLLSKKRAILGDDMGLGKTRQAIVAMKAAHPNGINLVVCPASLKLNWKREIEIIYPEDSIDVLGYSKHSKTNPNWVIVNYEILGKNAEKLNSIHWNGVILDEAHFIKNASKRTSNCLKLLGVNDVKNTPIIGPEYVFLLTGTPMTNRPKDLFNLLRCVGHPSSRSFLSFAKRYCDAYRNDFGWVTTGASNIEELNLLMKEIMLRRVKEEVLDLPPKIRSWIPVDIRHSKSALNATFDFLSWYSNTDPSKPNDTQFLSKLTKVRVALHKAKQKSVSERVSDVINSSKKCIVFTCFNDGIEKHLKNFGDKALSITGKLSSDKKMNIVDRFQNDDGIRVLFCNIIAGGVGINLTAGTHVIFQDLDWVPANHAQAEDRCYRLGQTEKVTVEYFHAASSLDEYIAQLLSKKMELIHAVEAEEVPDASILKNLQTDLRLLAPSMMEEIRLSRETNENLLQIESLAQAFTSKNKEEIEINQSGSWEFGSDRDPTVTYQVTYGRAGHLECNCKGFEFRGNCKHVQNVRQKELN